MTRFLNFILGAAVFALLAVPGVAAAQAGSGVDEQTGPVSFANAASGNIHSGKVITETQRSPLRAGQSKLSQDRATVPKSGDQGEIAAMGPNYLVHLGRFGASNPFPAGVKSKDHDVVAELTDTNVPIASATANYALLDNGRANPRPLDNSVVVFQNAKTSVDCSDTHAPKATASADKLWVRNGNDALAPAVVPAGTKKLEVANIKVGAPMNVDGVDKAKTTSKLTIGRLTAFDQLIKQDAWRSGDITVAAGWQIDIDTHVVKTDGTSTNIHTKIVLGGVSCSLPKGFVAKPADADIQAIAITPPVPTNIPAGVSAPVVESGGGSPLGFALLGGGAALAVGAVLTLRRRRSPAARAGD
jgi:hypothetical protein